jgi:hypothetical protein
MPEAEVACLREAYGDARVILEYGSGASTRTATAMPGKFIMSVESDRDWAMDLQREIDAAKPASPAVIHYVNIGPTGAWGRPLDASHWQDFHRYPLDIWNKSFFRHPDVVLIDGRFRPACFMAVCLCIARPVTVLFDDYLTRPAYGVVERILAPLRTVGRMAVFEVVPGLVGPAEIPFAIGQFSEATFVKKRKDYKKTA